MFWCFNKDPSLASADAAGANPATGAHYKPAADFSSCELVAAGAGAASIVDCIIYSSTTATAKVCARCKDSQIANNAGT
jgi:hypothetical protein